MNQEFFKQAELAFAAYAKNLVTGDVDELKLRAESFSISQAKAFVANYTVEDQYSDSTGLSATVFKSTGPDQETFRFDAPSLSG